MMMLLGTYEIIEKIASDRKRTLYRAVEPVSGNRLLLKVFQDESRYAIDSFILKNEFDMLSSIQLPCCVHVLRIENIDGNPTLIMDDPGGMILKDYLLTHQLDMIQKLRLTIKIASAISQLHMAEIIHKNINPINIFVSNDGEEIVLAEFGLSERIGKHRETSFVGMGTPEYISPEQTGRTSRSIDYRSDVYSFGICLYKLFSEQLPFEGADINKLFYAHMTQVPVRPVLINSAIPLSLSDIIMKMIEKEPDDRYKSINGSLTDLECVLRILKGETSSNSFELGKSDVSMRFVIPIKPYGKATLFDAIEESKYRVQYGENRIVLLHGEKGSGKTYILKELYRKWLDQVGTVIFVDMTTLERAMPYHAVRQIMDRFIDIVQNGPAERRRAINEQIIMTAGPNMNLLITVLPSLAKIISYNPAEPPKDQFEHKPLIERLLIHIAELLITFDPPFIVMIDGLANIDVESVQVLKNLLQHRFARALMVVGSIEHESSLLLELLQAVETAETHSSISVLKIPECKVEDIQMIVRDSFGLTSKKANHLSKLIYKKTDGNTHYTMEFIKKCCEEEWIFFNTDFGGWDYKTNEIERFQTTVNVADRALEKFNQLDPFEIEILKISAGMGFEFSLEDLSHIANVNGQILSEMVTKALKYGLIAGRFSLSEKHDDKNPEMLYFRFSHESVYKKILDMTDEASRMEISYAYGHLLLEKGYGTTEELGNLLIHMNDAAPLLINSEEKRELARMNLEYAFRLKWIGIIDKALEHVAVGLNLLRTEQFNETDPLSFRLHLERAELSYLNKQFDEAESYFDALIGNCVIPINQAKALRIKMILYVNQGKMKETIILAEYALKALGVSFDGTPSSIKVGRELLNYNIGIFHKEIADLEKLPVSTDVEIFLITQIYMTLISVSYLVGKNLFIYVILRILNMTLRHGLTVHSSYAFSIYGLIAGSALGNPEKGIAYGDLGVRLAERFGNEDMQAKCHFTYGFFLNHWVNHPSGNLPHLTKAIELSYQTGDMIFYSYSVAAYILSLIDAGMPLNSVLESVDRFFGTVQDKHVDDVFNLLVLLRQVIFALQGNTDSPCSLNAVDFDEDAFEKKLKSSSMQSINAVYLVQKLKLNYLYGHYEQAHRICKQLLEYAPELMGLSVYPEYYQYYSLTLLEIDFTVEGRRRIISSNQRKLEKWMRFAPQNFRHRFLLVQGVWHQKHNQFVKAIRCLTEALQIAEKQGFLQDEALINDLIGRCYEDSNQIMVRRMYIKNAYARYKQWGAIAKESQLKECWSDINFEDSGENAVSSAKQIMSGLDGVASKQVDLLSVFKSAQTLSSKTTPEELLKRLIEIIAENAGSQKTIILMKKEILVPVAWTTPEGVTVIEEGKPETCDYPETIINQAARNQDVVIIEDVSKIAVLRKDHYVMQYNPVSMMCVPIIWKGNLTGILYLENNRLSGAFNKSRMEVMRVLTAQFVISYDNALLYESLRASEAELKIHKYELERIVDERTEELSMANFEIQMLLDHAGQGFFSFDESGRIGSELSRECYRIFHKNICGESVSELLGAYSKDEEASLINKIIEKSFKTAELFESKVYLSLLPNELQVQDKTIAIEYQMIEDSDSKRVMTILTDVTETHALMQIREEEKKNLKMIVRIIKNRNSFLRSLEDYGAFSLNGCRKLIEQEHDSNDIMTELFRMVHTFKGDFAQWGFSNTEAALHEIESLIAYQRTISDSMEEISEFIEELDFDKAIEKDLMILENTIGKSFLQGEEYYEISRTEIVALEELADQDDKEALSSKIKALRLINLKQLLIPYDDYVATLAFGLDKKVNPLQVVGEDLMIDRKYYHNLIKVLIHVFRNIMDYGIEDPEERLRRSKSEHGTITCRIRKTTVSTMAIDIEDDGSGIDSQNLLKILLQRDPDRSEFYLNQPYEELIQSIFSDGISTSGDITMISGRGIGLSAVHDEVNKLDGAIRVSSTPGVGTRFSIDLSIMT